MKDIPHGPQDGSNTLRDLRGLLATRERAGKVSDKSAHPYSDSDRGLRLLHKRITVTLVCNCTYNRHRIAVVDIG